MTSTVPLFHVDLELAGVGAGWTDVTADLLRKVPIQCSYGIMGSSPQDRVAGTGTFVFGLDNSESNSQGKLGLYSPGHANCLAGFTMGIGIRFRIEYMELNVTKWQGVIDSIEPSAGIYDERQTTVGCVDWMDEAARTKLNMIPVQLNRRSDQVFNTIVANVPKQPPGLQVGYGMEQYAYALDSSQDEGFSVLTEFQKLANSELGFVYTRGGVLTFEDRRRRGTVVSSVASFNGVNAMQASRSRNQIINRTKVTVHPRKVDTVGPGFLPSDLASCTAWWDASDLDATKGDGDQIQTWIDRVAGLSFTQATVSARPTLKKGMFNGNSTVHFDGVNDTMVSASTLAALIASGAGTIFIVTQCVGGGSLQHLLTDSGGAIIIGHRATPRAESTNAGVLAVVDGAATNTPYIHTWMHGSSTVYAGLSDTRDASLVSGAASGATTLTGTLLIRWVDGDIMTIVAFNTALSEADRMNVESYFANRAGITVPYPMTGLATGGQVVVFTLDQTPKIMQKTSYVFKAPYTNPAGSGTGGVRIGATQQIQPVATTDYKFNTKADGTGVDITTNLVVTCVFGGNTAQVTVQNNGVLDGYLTFFQFRGLGVYDQAEVILEAINQSSIDQYGENLLPFDMPYQSDPAVANDAANYLLAQDKSAVTVAYEIMFIANQSDAFIRQAILREISDRIDVIESQTAVNGSFFINGIVIDVDEEGIMTCALTVIPALTELYFTLDDPNLAQLDQTTKLAYGLWNRYWILGVAAVGTDTRVNP